MVVTGVEQQLTEKDAILEELNNHMLRAQVRMKVVEDKKSQEVHYEVGDLFLLKLHLYHQKSPS